jgi:outer membrane immunogenic protein
MPFDGCRFENYGNRQVGGIFARNPWVLATASTVAFAGAANAQGAGTPPVYSWTGFYVGVNVSVAGHEAAAQDLNGWGAGIPPPPYVTPWFNSQKTTTTYGGQVGYNLQISNFVVGVETDFNYVGSSNTFIPPNTLAVNCGMTCGVSATNELTWLSTFRGRAGFTIDRILVFGTAGAAIGQVNNHWGWGDRGFSDSQFSASGTRSGYVYGGGIELMVMPNWVVRAEGMRVDLGTSRSTISGQPFCCTAPGAFTTEFKNTANIGRVALNFRW